MDPADHFLAKAIESLATAESEFANRRYNSCANRCYYTCFPVAIAALLRANIASRNRHMWDHRYVQAEFVGQLINRRKVYPSRHRTTLAQNRDLRDRADYTTNHVSEIQARRALDRARAFVSDIREESFRDDS